METRIFFCADVHGSERAFRKFLNSWKFYSAQIIILAGDITGKVAVPLIEKSDGTFRTSYLGRDCILKTEREVEGMEEKIRFTGNYPFRTSEEKFKKLCADTEKQKEVVHRLIVENVDRWLALAEDYLKDKQVICYIMPGNDDVVSVDEVFKKYGRVINPEGRVVELDQYHEMASTGYTNLTPWKCPRDITEEDLTDKLEALISKVKEIKNACFNFHAPPYGSGLDMAPELDENLRPVSGGGKYISVGSKAVLKAIEKYQPLLSLHGHIHESKGSKKIGRTLCLNPGSEYSEGILRGFIIDLDRDKVKRTLAISG